MAAPQVPLAVHVSTPLPEHCVWPAAHTPVQAPATHVWLTQAVPAAHAPEAPHVSGWLLPEQLV